MGIDDKNIDDLLIAYLLGELELDTQKEIEQWIAASEENRKKYEQVEQIWTASESVDINFDSDAAWANVSEQISHQNIFLKNWMSIAASIILLIALGAYFLYTSPTTTVIYANNNLLPDTLSDGSTIRLNKNAQISYQSDFNSKKRELKLEGEAFFSVKKDPAKEFIVHTPSSRVEVLGTSFNISAVPADSLVTVFVKSGIVRFSYLSGNTEKDYQHIRLTVGEKVIYNKISRKITKSADKNQNQLDTYWINKKLSFDGTRLNDVIKILESVYDVKIILATPELGNCQVTVNFENSDIQEVLTVIASTFNLELQTNNKTYTLNGKACENP